MVTVTAEHPVVETERLRLRPFAESDIDTVARHCADYEFAKTTLALPWPYARHHAEAWIATHSKLWAAGTTWVSAIERREDQVLLGAIELRIEQDHLCGDLGYGVYPPYWGNGYASEAARGVIDHAFNVLGLQRVHAHHFACNPASGRVLQKCNMKREGTMRSRVRRFDTFHDTIHYAILKSDYDAGSAGR